MCGMNRPEHQSGTTQGAVGRCVAESACHATLDEPLSLQEPGERLACLAELSQRPGGQGDREGKAQADVPRPIRHNRMLDR
jgi:hypothetical protein